MLLVALLWQSRFGDAQTCAVQGRRAPLFWELDLA